MSLALVDTTADQPALPGLELTPTGLTLTDNDAFTPTTITSILGHLRRAEAAWNWIAGDLVLAAITQHGPTRGLGYITAANLYQAHLSRCAAVAQRIPHDRRHSNLSWSHHELVAGAPEQTQTRLLHLAETEGLSVRQLKAVIQQEYDDLNPQLADMPSSTVIRMPPAAALRPLVADNEDVWIMLQPSTGHWHIADQQPEP